MATSKYPSESVELPSKGWYYPPDHPLSAGTIDLYYMSAKHEDILTSKNLIEKGIAIDRLMEALIVNEQISYDDLLIGDKNGILVAARIMGYGKEYPISVVCPHCDSVNNLTVDLEQMADRTVIMDPDLKGKRDGFKFTLPVSKKVVQIKLFNHKDDKTLRKTIDSLEQKAGIQILPEVTLRLKHMIVAIDGNSDRDMISEFAENMSVRDSLALRHYVKTISPDINLSFNFICHTCNQTDDRMGVPIDVNFFWPNI